MKAIVHLLLSMYMLLLSVLPCTDSHARPNERTTTIAADTHRHPADSAANDLCSPLCSCSCCGMVLDTPAPVFSFTYGQFQHCEASRFGLIVPRFPSPLLPTWQPPQLS
ncbi:DUF6660 family protein [Spirosoma utsteinense]|uniref:DUF6660 family protein n=1 Tax=Spirosoma utsteinense TaxID=2585773 RepID=UPI00164538AC|nr:DUF6660 family protein [Spirosoma utsteinense]MBC3787760.1 hypothetical protein [Spirosoma utsteinense]